MSLGYLWLQAQRDWARGITAAWYDRVVCDKIDTLWQLPAEPKPTEAVPIHILTGSENLRLCLWMLASFFHYTGRNWQVFVHDDGTLTAKDNARLLAQHPTAQVFWRGESDRKMQAFLEKTYPRCWAYRQRHPLAAKCFDIPHFSQAERFLILDSDVLFFQRPVEILQWLDDASDKNCWFNADAVEPSPLNADETEQAFGHRLWPKVNSGLCLLQKAAIDFDQMEQWLAHPTLQTCNQWRVEQFLLGMSATVAGGGGLLPDSYEVSLGRKMLHPNPIARHYVGLVRDGFYREGIARLYPLFRK